MYDYLSSELDRFQKEQDRDEELEEYWEDRIADEKCDRMIQDEIDEREKK